MAMTTTAIYPATLPSSHHFQRPTRACKSEKTKFGISSHSIFTTPLRSNPRRIVRSGNEQISSSVEDGFVLEDVPHVTDHIPDLQAHPSPLQNSPAYAIVKQNFVTSDDVVAHRIVVQKNSSRGIHFRRAGPREHVYFKPSEVCACIVTCGGLCPGINTVIREIVCGLTYMYGVSNIFGIEV